MNEHVVEYCHVLVAVLMCFHTNHSLSSLWLFQYVYNGIVDQDSVTLPFALTSNSYSYLLSTNCYYEDRKLATCSYFKNR